MAGTCEVFDVYF